MTALALSREPELEPISGVAGSPTARALRRLLGKRIAVLSLAVIAVFYSAGIFASLVAPYGYSEQNLDKSFEGPSLAHPFGTDRNGRDTLSRNIFAARTTVIVSVATVAAGGIVLPLTLGLLAGYRRGIVDAVIMRTGEILGALPGLPMLLLVNTTLRPRIKTWLTDTSGQVHVDFLANSNFLDYFLIFFFLSWFGWVGSSRLIRSQVLTLRRSEFIIAAEASGAGTVRILFRHLLPSVMPIVIVGVSAGLGAVAGTEIALTFLGVGIQPPHPSFGALITDGASRAVLENHPQLLLVPAAMVASLLFAFNLLGDALNDVFTPRAR
ncbi:MAG: ABC transporter permease [Chloroflexi bacterium]|nr:ABC transporter permease [Chloroflexota bacterium]